MCGAIRRFGRPTAEPKLSRHRKNRAIDGSIRVLHGNDVETGRLDDAATECWRTVATPDSTLVVETDCTLQANPNRLRQILQNTFRNSVEHGSTSSRTQSGDSVEHGSTGNRTQSGDDLDASDADVTVTVGTPDDGTGFHVEDDEPGIPASDRVDVFESGYSTSGSGTGVGLAIVEQMVAAHGWTVRVAEGSE